MESADNGKPQVLDATAIRAQLRMPDAAVILPVPAPVQRPAAVAVGENVPLFVGEAEPPREPPLMSRQRGVKQGLDRSVRFSVPPPNTATRCQQTTLFG